MPIGWPQSIQTSGIGTMLVHSGSFNVCFPRCGIQMAVSFDLGGRKFVDTIYSRLPLNKFGLGDEMGVPPFLVIA